MASEEYTRLHITPLNPALLTTILPPSILPNARNISYHTIQTFPEKGYGYVELPTMDADKIKKKLNGSILKGTKVRIEKARPEKELSVQPDEPERPKKSRDKKRKRDETIPGAEIGERSVKRGWTIPAVLGKSAKDRAKDKNKVKSKFTMKQECLFKTVLPPNKAANADAKDRKGKGKKEAVVHEFSKTTKYATFLRGSNTTGGTKTVKEFVEGKGWVDEDGNVIEEVKKTKKTTKPVVESKAPVVEDSSSEAESSEEDDSSEDSSEEESDQDSEHLAAGPASREPLKPAQGDEGSDDSSSEEEAPAAASTPKAGPKPVVEDSETSTSGSSSEDSDAESDDSSESSEDDSDEASSEPSEEQVDSRPVSRPQSSSGPPIGLSIKIPPSASSTPISAVHPLEALYKKPKTDSKEASKPEAPTFSFFGADGEADEEMDEVPAQLPLTPFTQRDFEYRGIRSAAPTPDTAHPNKRFTWPTENSDDENDDAPSSPIRKSTPGESSRKEEGTAPESDFQKWFYEHRGETTRAWKKRRRTAAKEKRHRENKKRESRAI